MSNSLPAIRAVIVLYKMELQESPAFLSMTEILAAEPDLARAIHVSVYDNTPSPQRTCAIPDLEYYHDTLNPGLCDRYNHALTRAEREGNQWLMLLDQDTTVTREYIREAIARSEEFTDDVSVVALAPKLVEGGIVHSPRGDFIQTTPEFISPDFAGFPARYLRYFNSGSVMRVSALRTIGGFPTTFWLDYLDHSTYSELQSRGGRIYILSSNLPHLLSTEQKIRGWNRAYLAKHRNLLDAEYKFYVRYANSRQKRWYKLRLIRHLFGSMKHLRLPMVWQLARTLVRVDK